MVAKMCTWFNNAQYDFTLCISVWQDVGIIKEVETVSLDFFVGVFVVGDLLWRHVVELLVNNNGSTIYEKEYNVRTGLQQSTNLQKLH